MRRILDLRIVRWEFKLLYVAAAFGIGYPLRALLFAAGAPTFVASIVDALVTIGAFVLGIAVLLTIVNVVTSLKKGAIAGPDPWKANTLEWFTPSPPPENNFDVVPRVRSVEPMKDIRRQVEQQTGTQQRYQSGRPVANV